MPKRHSRRRSQTSRAASSARPAPAGGRVRLSTSAVVSVWIAAKFSALMRSARRRMPASVADISEARCTWLGWRYLSITACSVPPSSRGRGGEGQPRLGLRRDAQPHRQRAHRVQPGVERRAARRASAARRRVEVGQRLAGVAVAAEPALAVGLHAHAQHLRIAVGQEVRRVQRRARWPGAACARTHSACCAACHSARTNRFEKAGCASSARGVGQRHLEGRDQLDVERALAQVAQLDLAELDVVLRADPDRGVRLQLGPGGVEAHAVGVEGAAVVRRRVGRRVLGDRHRRAACAVPAQVEEAAVRVAQRVVAPARDAGARPSGSSRRRWRAAPRCSGRSTAGASAPAPSRPAAPRAAGPGARRCSACGGGPAGGACSSRHLARRALVQQRGHGLDVRRWPCPSAAPRRRAARWPAPRCSCPGGAP